VHSVLPDGRRLGIYVAAAAPLALAGMALLARAATRCPRRRRP
jgi:hypothetical protein